MVLAAGLTAPCAAPTRPWGTTRRLLATRALALATGPLERELGPRERRVETSAAVAMATAFSERACCRRLDAAPWLVEFGLVLSSQELGRVFMCACVCVFGAMHVGKHEAGACLGGYTHYVYEVKS